MPSTYDPIATTTLGSDTASITFSSISGSYTDLVLVLYHKESSASGLVLVELNSNTTNNDYSCTRMTADSGGISSDRSNGANGTNQRFISWARTEWATTIMNFQNYASANVFKTIVGRNSNSTPVSANVILWRKTEAITSIKVAPDSVNFSSGTVATLFGIKKAS